MEFAQENNLLFMETSAFTDIHVRDGFELLVQEIYNVKSREGGSNNGNKNGAGGKVLIHNDLSIEKKNEGGCC